MSGQETEVKFYVNNLKRLETRLIELGATLVQPRVLETNLRFDLPDGTLRAEGRALRLRRADDVRLTYKGRTETIHGVSSREEIEFTVGDFETARHFIEALGYVQFALYEKFRATYELKLFEIISTEGSIQENFGNTVRVMLDELPYGTFTEIEGAGFHAIQSAAKRLGLDWDTAVSTSYLELHKRLCAYLPLNSTQLTFESLKGFHPTSTMLNVRPADP